jgi:hypothetical protein
MLLAPGAAPVPRHAHGVRFLAQPPDADAIGQSTVREGIEGIPRRLGRSPE